MPRIALHAYKGSKILEAELTRLTAANIKHWYTGPPTGGGGYPLTFDNLTEKEVKIHILKNFHYI